jgi:putative phosphoesterase
VAVVSIRERAFRLKSGRIGVISDTHGLLRAEALAALRGSEMILHAGDIGKAEVLEALETIAPVIAIRGNNDRGSWAQKLPDIWRLRVNGCGICVVHNVRELKRDPAGDFQLVVSGHSHKPSAVRRGGVFYLNPGSAGPRRFTLPVSVARLNVRRNRLRVKIIEIV